MEDSIPPAWAKQMIVDIIDLKKQTIINCGKLDKISDKLSETSKKLDGHNLTEIFDICQANGQGIEVISRRIDSLSKN